jgi:hypothetical protein
MKKTILILTALASLTIAGLAQEKPNHYQLIIGQSEVYKINTTDGTTWIMRENGPGGNKYWERVSEAVK